MNSSLLLAPDDGLLNVAHVRNASLKLGTLDDNLVVLIIPACARVDLGAERVQGLGGHVAELALGVGHEALAGGIHGAIAQLGGRVLGIVALDQAGIVGKGIGGAASLLGRRLALVARAHRGRRLGRAGVGRLERADPVVNVAGVVVFVEVHGRILTAVVVEVFHVRLVSVHLGPVNLEAGCGNVAVLVDPGTVHILFIVYARHNLVGVVPVI